MTKKTTTKTRLIKPILDGELDKVPPGHWAAIIEGKVVAHAPTLEELEETMTQRGYSNEDHGVVKLSSTELLAT